MKYDNINNITTKTINGHFPKKEDFPNIVRRDNTSSLNNFLRYGETGPLTHPKNKSLAEILFLTDAQCLVLVNFIELYKINKTLIERENVINTKDSALTRLLMTVTYSPSRLPVFFLKNNVDEEIFYYLLVKEIHRLLSNYFEFCKINGVERLEKVNIEDIVYFNGILREIFVKVSDQLTKVRLTHILDEDELMKIDSSIYPYFETNIYEEMMKDDYPSRFSIPTIIRNLKSITISNENIEELFLQIQDNDIIYLPNMEDNSIYNTNFIINDKKNIKIVSNKATISGSFYLTNVENCEFVNIKFESEESNYQPILVNGSNNFKFYKCDFINANLINIMDSNTDEDEKTSFKISQTTLNVDTFIN